MMKIGSEILVEAGIPFKCNQCEKTFCDNERLGNHKRNVHVEATWGCDICARVYKTKSDLRKHQKEIMIRMEIEKRAIFVQKKLSISRATLADNIPKARQSCAKYA